MKVKQLIEALEEYAHTWGGEHEVEFWCWEAEDDSIEFEFECLKQGFDAEIVACCEVRLKESK